MSPLTRVSSDLYYMYWVTSVWSEKGEQVNRMVENNIFLCFIKSDSSAGIFTKHILLILSKDLDILVDLLLVPI